MARDLRLNVDGDSGSAQKALEESAAAVDLLRHEADRLGNEFKKTTRDAAELDAKLLETKAAAAALAKEFAKTNDAGIKKELDAQRAAAGDLQKLRRDIVGNTERDAKAAEAAWSKAADGLERDTARVARSVAQEARKAADETDKAAKMAAKAAEKMAADVEKARKKHESTPSSLDEIKTEFGALFGGAGQAFSGGIGSPVGLGLAGALALPAVAGAGGATIGAAGIGAVGLGVAGAVAGDPERFKAEWSRQIGAVKADWISASAAFTGPTIDAIRSVGPLVASWHIDATFAKAATYVQPLVSGVEGMATGIEHGVAALVDKAGPVFTTLANDLPAFGQMIGDGLSSIADNAQGGAQALGDIIQLVGGITDALLHAVGAAEHVYQVFKEMDVEASNFIRKHQSNLALITSGLSNVALATSDAFNSDEVQHFAHALDGVKLSGNLAADQAAADAAQYEKLSQQLGVAAVKADSLATGASQLFQQLLAADHATLSWDESLTSLGESFKTNGKTIDEHTKKGQANREAILSSIAANAQLYVSNIEQGKTVDQATAAYDKNEKALEATARQAGLSQAQIDQLVGRYKSVPDTIKTDIKMQGLTDAINGLDDVLRRINHLPPRKQVNIDVVVGGQIGLAETLLGAGIIGSLAPKHKAMGGIRHAAAGAIVPPSDPGTLVVGEPPTGGELWMPLAGVSQGRAQSLLQTAATGYGLDVSRRTAVPAGLFGRGGGSDGAVAVTIEFGGAVDTAMGAAFMKLLRTGDVQIRARQVLP
jgi:hypothetical protein